jgi:hypothetical protein
MMPWQRRDDTFSEFTYGFALVNELVGPPNPPILSVPIFPSLLAEGRTGGGYDVALNRPGRPLFLQFKLARRIVGWRAREFQQGVFSRRFYRMYVRPKASSRQHQLLLELERQRIGRVYYCAPAFHTLGQLNDFYNANRIARYSRFVKPSELPLISDDEDHWLSFQRARGGTKKFYSEEGREIELDETPIIEQLRELVPRPNDAPLKETIGILLSWFDEHTPQQAWSFIDDVDDDPERREDVERLSGIRPEATPLERVAILSHTMLNSTFCVVQPRAQ